MVAGGRIRNRNQESEGRRAVLSVARRSLRPREGVLGGWSILIAESSHIGLVHLYLSQRRRLTSTIVSQTLSNAKSSKSHLLHRLAIDIWVQLLEIFACFMSPGLAETFLC